MAKYHVRVPMKAKALVRVSCFSGQSSIMDMAEQLIDKGEFDQTCEHFDYDNAQIVIVCEECGAELYGDEETEIGVCKECQEKEKQQISEERKHPDDKG